MAELRLEWKHLIALLVLCMLFIPARIYTLPVTLPFELDPYRLLLIILGFVWLLALLSDRDLSTRPSGLGGPLTLYFVAVIASLLANRARVELYQSEVVKTLLVSASLLLAFSLTVSVLRGLEEVEYVLGVVVLGGGVLGVLAVIESRTGWSPFTHLDQYIPFLVKNGPDTGLRRGGHFRAFGSSEHPIAFGALLAMLAPIAVAMAVRRRSAIWWVALAALVMGAVSTGSRTAALMLVAEFALLCVLRWNEAKRFAPLAVAIIPMIHLVSPGTLGAFRIGLTPSYAVKEQESLATSQLSGGRIADLSPSFKQWEQKPVLGYGRGTRIVTGNDANSRLLDNQWLGSLLDTGMIGVFALAWVFARFIGRLTRASAVAAPRDGILLAALACSAFGFAIGMWFYDAFAFVQVTLIFFLILGVGSALALAPGRVFESLPESVVSPGSARATRRRRLAERLAWQRRGALGRLRRFGLRSAEEDMLA